MCRKWIIRDGVVTVQGDKENLTCLEKICRLDGKMRKYYEMIYQALDEFTENLIVDDFKKGKAYNEGDYCLYDDTLWLCIASHTATDFDPTKWQKVTVTDVLKILNDMLRTTIETVNTTVQSVNITIQTVQGLIATVTEMQGTMGSYNDRITALENAGTDSKMIIYDATLSISGTNANLQLSGDIVWQTIKTDIVDNKKNVIIRAYDATSQNYYDFNFNAFHAVSSTDYYFSLMTMASVNGATKIGFWLNDPATMHSVQQNNCMMYYREFIPSI